MWPMFNFPASAILPCRAGILSSGSVGYSSLLKRRQLKDKKVVILKDMARDLAERLKKLKEKHSVDSAWFTNGRINYKLIKGWHKNS